MPPEQPAPDPGRAVRLGLVEDHDVPWRPVSRALTRVRSIALALTLLVPVVAAALTAVLVWRWAWAVVAVLAASWAWAQWIVVRQVTAISYAELPDELAIRKGRMYRTLVTIPYGRIQYVDVSAGPLLRAHGLAGIEVHTANPASSGDIPGLPAAEAERLRERLTSLGEHRRAGL